MDLVYKFFKPVGLLGVPSRGIELMADRQNIALQIRDGVIFDTETIHRILSTMVELMLADFTQGMIPLSKPTNPM